MSLLNPAGAIYRTEYFYLSRGIMCRNSFHHYTELPGAGAQFINQQVFARMVVPIFGVQSAYITPVQLVTSLQTGNFPDSYAHFFTGETGLIAATPSDPRLGCLIKHETDAFAREHYTGATNLGGLPQNWTQDSPVFHDSGVIAVRNLFDSFVAGMGKGNNASSIKWVVYSRTLFEANPSDPQFWSERISHIGVRRQLVTLRTRRPKVVI